MSSPLPGYGAVNSMQAHGLQRLMANQGAQGAAQPQAGLNPGLDPGLMGGLSGPLAASRAKILNATEDWRTLYNQPQAQQLAQQIMARASGANQPYDQQAINRVAGVGADASAAGLAQSQNMIRQQAAAQGMSGGNMGAMRRAQREHQKNVRGSRRDAEIRANDANYAAQVGGQQQHQAFLGQQAANQGAATSLLVDYLRNDEFTSGAGGGGTFSARGKASPGAQMGFQLGNFEQRQVGGGDANDAGNWRARAQARDERSAAQDAARDQRRQAGQAARAARGPGGPAYGFVHGNEVASSFNNPMLGNLQPTPQQLAAMGMPATTVAQQAQPVQQAQGYVSNMFMGQPAPTSQQPGAPFPQLPPGFQRPAPAPEPSSGVSRSWGGWGEGQGLSMDGVPGLMPPMQPAQPGTASPYVRGGGDGGDFYQPPVQGPSPSLQGLPPIKSAAEMYAEADHERQLQAAQATAPGMLDQLAALAQGALANLQQFGQDWSNAPNPLAPVQAGPVQIAGEQDPKQAFLNATKVGGSADQAVGAFQDRIAESINQADEGNDALSRFVRSLWSNWLFPDPVKVPTYKSR